MIGDTAVTFAFLTDPNDFLKVGKRLKMMNVSVTARIEVRKINEIVGND